MENTGHRCTPTSPQRPAPLPASQAPASPGPRAVRESEPHRSAQRRPAEGSGPAQPQVGELAEHRRDRVPPRAPRRGPPPAADTSSPPRPSPVLLSCGLPLDVARNALRLSVGRSTSMAEVDLVVQDLKQAVARLERPPDARAAS